MKKLKKGSVSNIILILVFLVGLTLLLYPTVSDYWNSFHQSRAIADYARQVGNLGNDAYNSLWDEARAYNETLIGKAGRFTMSDAEKKEYESILNIPGTGVIGYIRITKINCYLPIYHGTDESVLQAGVGHLQGSSFPVGGESTHCVISGHRGVPNAKLFTNLDRLEEGDTFVLHTLDETLTYEVDQIRIVEPDDIRDLAIVEGEDYCTLITCTPYGINTHRLLLRGHRVDNASEVGTVRITADAMQIEPAIVAPLVAAPMLLLLLIILLISTRKKKR